MKRIEISFNGYNITTDRNKMNVTAIHDFLSNHSGWSNNIPIEKIQISIDNSLNFGLFHNGEQIDFARVISDFSTIAYLGDVYVLDKYRVLGL
nr:hypothetical protein [uncultured Flavobacterium sp.]